ncbi:alpha/beta fold hydrolase [Streptomyces sp. RY43-2]|uniref:Alpha/beta fold hydrolase n=1 Tax=Streptomyces macrolidinus TaxID=2952607 RepID=A0ABT0ZIF3_9ACTN|nr:alpha/beta fold hydrolase [Streptomyces macrolidinus]MCN9243353.1 alpha/beta fold hydrolase [Streptomyces macrolidinus]
MRRPPAAPATAIRALDPAQRTEPEDPRPAVLCFPHAGGCASFFRPWQPLLPTARVHAVQYPGREDRILDESPVDLRALAEAVAEEILAGGERYSLLFGHSMGAYVAFEVAACLRDAGAEAPTLVVSSAAAPALRPPVPYEDTADVLRYLERYEPLSPQIRQDEELLELILDYIKEDLRLVAHYHEHVGKRIDARLVAVVGADDIPEIRARFRPWRQHTDGAFVPVVTPGGHFYLRERPPVGLIAAELARHTRYPHPVGHRSWEKAS